VTRKRRDPTTRTIVHLPERKLSECILDLAAPRLERLGSSASVHEKRRVLGVAIAIWNAHVNASLLWGGPQKPLKELRKAMCGRDAPPESAEIFAELSARWQRMAALDPRLVGSWSFDAADGSPELECELILPEGLEAYVPPPDEKRIAIGGRFLDEVRTRQSRTTYLAFPIENHRGEIGDSDVATIYTKYPTVIGLFAQGVLSPIGGAPVDLKVKGKDLRSMVLGDVHCTGYAGHSDVVLVFRRVSPDVPAATE
jgi:hypothetical protein